MVRFYPLSAASFLANINGAGGSLAHSNRFQVYIPTAVLTASSSAISNAISSTSQFPDTDATDWMYEYADGASDYYRLTAFCDKSELPGYQFQTDTQRIYGPAFKFPHMPEWTDVTMSFLCGSDMEEKYFFDAWQYMVMDPESNNFNYRDEYAVDINVVEYDELNNVNYVITLVSAYPVSISPVPVSYEDNNSVMKLQVTFTYKYGRQFNGAFGNNSPRGVREIFNNTINQNTPGAQ